MSRGACLTLAILMLAAAAGFTAIGTLIGRDLPAGPWPFYGLAAFSLVVAVACAARGSRPATLRVIGAAVFAAYAWYAVDAFGDRLFARALAGFFVWGLPAAHLAVRGAWPQWGRLSRAFNGDGRS